MQQTLGNVLLTVGLFVGLLVYTNERIIFEKDCNPKKTSKDELNVSRYLSRICFKAWSGSRFIVFTETKRRFKYASSMYFYGASFDFIYCFIMRISLQCGLKDDFLENMRILAISDFIRSAILFFWREV